MSLDVCILVDALEAGDAAYLGRKEREVGLCAGSLGSFAGKTFMPGPAFPAAWRDAFLGECRGCVRAAGAGTPETEGVPAGGDTGCSHTPPCGWQSLRQSLTVQGCYSSEVTVNFRFVMLYCIDHPVEPLDPAAYIVELTSEEARDEERIEEVVDEALPRRFWWYGSRAVEDVQFLHCARSLGSHVKMVKIVDSSKDNQPVHVIIRGC